MEKMHGLKTKLFLYINTKFWEEKSELWGIDLDLQVKNPKSEIKSSHSIFFYSMKKRDWNWKKS